MKNWQLELETNCGSDILPLSNNESVEMKIALCNSTMNYDEDLFPTMIVVVASYYRVNVCQDDAVVDCLLLDDICHHCYLFGFLIYDDHLSFPTYPDDREI